MSVSLKGLRPRRSACAPHSLNSGHNSLQRSALSPPILWFKDFAGSQTIMVFFTKKKHILPLWVESWLFLSGVICALDVTFTMLRPITTTGWLAKPFAGWNLYADVDIRYASTHDVPTMATGRVMLIEILMNFIAVWMNRTSNRHTLATAFTTTCFVFWKTVWYLTMFIAPPPGVPSDFTAHSSHLRIFLVFWIPNGVWVVLPFLVMIALWNKISPVGYSECSTEISKDEC